MKKEKTPLSGILSGKNRKYVLPSLLALLAVTLLLLSSVGADRPKTETDLSELTAEHVTERLEEKIKIMCTKVKGVSDVCVMLTLDTSEEYVYASDTEKSETFQRSELVTSDGGGVELYVISPRVRGVAVVCKGGDSAVIKKTLTDLISCALGIPSSSISIAGG